MRPARDGGRGFQGCAGLDADSRVSTTQDVYQQVLLESQRKAVKKLSAFVMASVRETAAAQ
jgi:hypothetical protein